MKINLLISYIKARVPGILLITLLLVGSLIKGESIGWILFFGIYAIHDYYKYQRLIVTLRKKGLIEKDLVNIQFTQQWYKTRKLGLWRYCLYDGVLLRALLLSLLLGLMALYQENMHQTLPNLNNIIGSVFKYIIAGFITGFIINRVLWIYNERRFNRLTQPIS